MARFGEVAHFLCIFFISQVATSNAQGGDSATPLSLQDGSSGVVDGSTRKCVKHVPRMPKRFVAKRKWMTLLNTISFQDQDTGKEIGYVQSWLIDWKNPFGYPGATFYMKTLPNSGKQGIWHFNPSPPADVPSAPTAAGGATDEANLRNGVIGRIRNREIADIREMTSPDKHFLTTGYVEVEDCQNKSLFEAGKGVIRMHHGGTDAKYQTIKQSTKNSLVLYDLGTPSRELVRLTMWEPCWPFPPFCQQMGKSNWFYYWDNWEGEILLPEYDTSTGGSGPKMGLKVTDGAATDMRFLTLYSSYQFSNTRWSPLMRIMMAVLMIVCCICCFRCCCIKLPTKGKAREKKVGEETEGLLSTREMETRPPKTGVAGTFACCSRRQNPADDPKFWTTRQAEMQTIVKK